MKTASLLSLATCVVAGGTVLPSHAQSPLTPQPVINISASATAALPNDRMFAWFRAEADNADPVAAAGEVNARMAKALSRAKAVKGVLAATTAYSSFQVTERNQPTRWRVAQTLQLESGDFAALAALVTKIQSEDALVLSGINFSVSPEARRAAEDTLTEQAIKSWQARAQNAARGFGAAGWRAGHVTIQTGDFARPPLPMLRAAGAPAVAAAPVATEGGTSDVTVTVSGEAILEPARTGAK
jgi:predicted secreted protein